MLMDDFCIAYPRYDYFSISGGSFFTADSLAERGAERADEERGGARPSVLAPVCEANRTTEASGGRGTA